MIFGCEEKPRFLQGQHVEEAYMRAAPLPNSWTNTSKERERRHPNVVCDGFVEIKSNL